LPAPRCPGRTNTPSSPGSDTSAASFGRPVTGGQLFWHTLLQADTDPGGAGSEDCPPDPPRETRRPLLRHGILYEPVPEGWNDFTDLSTIAQPVLGIHNFPYYLRNR
jgi:hypothetical protein